MFPQDLSIREEHLASCDNTQLGMMNFLIHSVTTNFKGFELMMDKDKASLTITLSLLTFVLIGGLEHQNL